ncbi:MAG: hypothetical protein HZA64_11595 [Rhodocyclales bacterium]|nr:hypothetical protein [Rhodocyclales bacterium]
MSMFSEDFIAKIQQDPVEGTIAACVMAQKAVSSTVVFNQLDYNALTEAYALLMELQEAGILPIEIDLIEFSGSSQIDSKKIYDQLSVIRGRCTEESAKLRLKTFRSHFKASLGSTFHYEFSQGDLERVQELVNQLRQAVSESRHLQADHRQRLLRRLESLQSELHKKMSDLDRFWGLIGDAGVVLGKLGSDAKPLVDRIREIADIVWRTQSRAEELPSGTRPPLLEDRSDVGTQELP